MYEKELPVVDTGPAILELVPSVEAYVGFPSLSSSFCDIINLGQFLGDFLITVTFSSSMYQGVPPGLLDLGLTIKLLFLSGVTHSLVWKSGLSPVKTLLIGGNATLPPVPAMHLFIFIFLGSE